MTPTPGSAPFVVGLDGSAESVHALQWALDEARVLSAPVVVVHAWQADDVRVTGAAGQATVTRAESEREALSLIDDQLRAAGFTYSRDDAVVRRAVEGDPKGVLIVESTGAHALVVASRRKTRLGRLVLGSVSEACVHGAHCPVVVVHRQVRTAAEEPGPWRIAVGVDGSAESEKALEFAAEHGRARRAELSLVGAVPPSAMDQDLAEVEVLLKTVAHRFRNPEVALYFVPHAAAGEPEDVLVEAARHADLLVVGRRGRGATMSSLGSVADVCVRTAACPVAVVPA